MMTLEQKALLEALSRASLLQFRREAIRVSLSDLKTLTACLVKAEEALRPFATCDGSCVTCAQAGEPCANRQARLTLMEIRGVMHENIFGSREGFP